MRPKLRKAESIKCIYGDLAPTPAIGGLLVVNSRLRRIMIRPSERRMLTPIKTKSLKLNPMVDIVSEAGCGVASGAGVVIVSGAGGGTTSGVGVIASPTGGVIITSGDAGSDAGAGTGGSPRVVKVYSADFARLPALSFDRVL